MERRLQLLLDQQRFDRVAAEAERSGRSVAAVIREAIDVRFDDSARRSAAMGRFLDLTADNDDEPGYDVAERHELLDRELDDHYERLPSQ